MTKKRRRRSPEQIIRKLEEGHRQLVAGMELDEVCRHQFGGAGPSEEVGDRIAEAFLAGERGVLSPDGQAAVGVVGDGPVYP